MHSYFHTMFLYSFGLASAFRARTQDAVLLLAKSYLKANVLVHLKG